MSAKFTTQRSRNANRSVSFVIPAKAGIQEKTVNTQPAVYILAPKRNGTLHVGVTSEVLKSIWEHKSSIMEGFTKRNKVHQLIRLPAFAGTCFAGIITRLYDWIPAFAGMT